MHIDKIARGAELLKKKVEFTREIANAEAAIQNNQTRSMSFYDNSNYPVFVLKGKDNLFFIKEILEMHLNTLRAALNHVNIQIMSL